MEENYTVEGALEDELLAQIEELGRQDPASEEYTKVAQTVTSLYKVRNEQQKIESDYALETENQAIKREQLDADTKSKSNQTKVDAIGHVAKGVGTVLAIGANTAWILWTMASEKEGHIPGITAATKFLTKIKIL